MARCDALFSVLLAMGGQSVPDSHSKAPIDELWRLRESNKELAPDIDRRIGTPWGVFARVVGCVRASRGGVWVCVWEGQ